MFGDYQEHSMSVVVGDPGADDKQIFLWRAPKAVEIKRAYIVTANSQGAGSAGEFMLQYWTSAGTPALSGTVAAALGGTASSSRLTAELPVAYTISEGTLAAGQWLVLDYQETGDFVEGTVSIVWDYVIGVGA